MLEADGLMNTGFVYVTQFKLQVIHLELVSMHCIPQRGSR